VNPALLKSVMGLLVAIICLAGEGYVLMHGVPAALDPVVTGRILGTLDSILVMIVSYFFGSSDGSARKTEILSEGLAGARAPLQREEK
jgi:hypothetical protein